MNAFTYYEVKHRVTWERFEQVGNFATLTAARNYINNLGRCDMSIIEHNFVINPDDSVIDNQRSIE